LDTKKAAKPNFNANGRQKYSSFVLKHQFDQFFWFNFCYYCLKTLQPMWTSLNDTARPWKEARMHFCIFKKQFKLYLLLVRRTGGAGGLSSSSDMVSVFSDLPSTTPNLEPQKNDKSERIPT